MDNASDRVTATMGAPPAWFRNRNTAFTQTVRYQLFDEATAADQVLFRHGGLTVLAPPLRYSFSTSLDRIPGAVADRRRHAGNAATYLRQLVQAQDPVPRTEIIRLQYDQDAATLVDNVYQVSHLAAGIV